MRRDLSELVEEGTIARACTLSEVTGQRFSDDEYPKFFTGDLDASFVLVHLNPKHDDDAAPRSLRQLPIRTFEQYFDLFRHFGAYMYGPRSTGRHRSPFDNKQIRFLRPFDVIDFVDEGRRSERRVNLERVIDRNSSSN
jgi:hypothetical protein